MKIIDERSGVAAAIVLDLNNSHVPGEFPDFGNLRVVDHEYGWIVFVPAPDAVENYRIPEWIRPIMEVACRLACILINFDQDAPVQQFKTYDW